jgi:hypothetical protein
VLKDPIYTSKMVMLFLFIQVNDNLEIDKEGKETWTQRQIQTKEIIE